MVTFKLTGFGTSLLTIKNILVTYYFLILNLFFKKKNRKKNQIIFLILHQHMNLVKN